MLKRKVVLLIILLFFSALFIIHAVSQTFTQDDAFISYRYVKNFLNGDGLVFNQGERVEGYTNFFLIILMIFFSLFGANYILISKIIGITSGIGIFVVMALWINKILDRRQSYIVTFAVLLLLTANGAFAYWAISGLETLLFSALIFWGLYLASNKNMLFVPIMAVATLTRPEGALVFVLIMLYYLITNSRWAKIGKYCLIYTVLLLPQLIFRLYYYHDILPNPFYAKTGWSVEYFLSGVQYVWLFLQHYGFYGILIILPLVFHKALPNKVRLPGLVVTGYVLYILLIGGDVLHGHRFFIPLLPLLYMLFIITINHLIEKIFPRRSNYISSTVLMILLVAGILTFVLPRAWIQRIHFAESKLTSNMTSDAEYINKAGRKGLTIACTTIGAFSYYSDARIIDMLGLTDKTIAKNPQSITTIKSTWKERNYNIPYLMEREPDLILFSTGIKPSAPAEKALFLSSKFRNGYYPVYHQEGNDLEVIYRHKPGFIGDDKYLTDPEFISLYSKALDHNMRREFEQAYKQACRSIDLAPPDFYLPYVLAGTILLEINKQDEAVDYFKQSFELSDGYDLHAGDMLRRYYKLENDTAKANEYFRIIFDRNKLY